MSTCRAIVFNGNDTYEEREFAIPEPVPGGAVLRVEAVGLCGSDIMQFHGHAHVPGEVSPVVPGHEIVGRIAALAPDAKLGVAVGQRVGVGPTAPNPEKPIGFDLYGYTMHPDEPHGPWGGYAEYMGIRPGTQLVPLTDALPAAELSLVEALGSIIHWSERMGLGPDDRLVVQGPGHMGLIAVAWAASEIGVRQIVVTGTSRDGLRLDAAKELGAHDVVDIDAEPDLVAHIRRLTRGGPSAVMDMTPGATQPIVDAIAMARGDARILLAGLKGERPVEIVSDTIIMKRLSILSGPGSTPETMARAAEVLNAGLFPTAALRGEVYTLDQLDEALAMLDRKLEGRDAVRINLVHP